MSQGPKCTNFFGLVTGHREDVRMFRKSHKFGGNGSKNPIFVRAQARLIGEAATTNEVRVFSCRFVLKRLGSRGVLTNRHL